MWHMSKKVTDIVHQAWCITEERSSAEYNLHSVSKRQFTVTYNL